MFSPRELPVHRSCPPVEYKYKCLLERATCLFFKVNKTDKTIKPVVNDDHNWRRAGRGSFSPYPLPSWLQQTVANS